MDLLIRIEIDSDRVFHDVRVEVVSEHTVADLANAIATYAQIQGPIALALRSDSEIRPLAPSASIRDVNLVSGDVIVVNSSSWDSDLGTSGGGAHLVVVSGMDAGLSLRLNPGGSYSVGRETGNDLRLNDPQVSRADFSIAVAPDGGVTLDGGEGRSNELRLAGRPVVGATRLNEGDLFQVGASTLSLRHVAERPTRATDAFGAVPYHRTPYMFQPVESRVFEPLGRIPVKPKPRRFQFIAALAPLLTGVVMALVLGSPRFMIFAVMSPIIAIGTHFDNKRTGGNDYDDGVQQLDERISERRDQVWSALNTERAVRIMNAPDTVQLVEQAKRHDRSLWVRSRASDDFLKLRVGLGVLKPDLEVKPEKQGDDDLRDKVTDAFQGIDLLVDVPITLDLRKQAVTALVGPESETSLVATSLVVQASCLHSPEDLVIVSAVTASRRVNDSLKWLPHVRSKNSPLGDSHLADDRVGADRLLRAVASVAEQRALSKDHQLDLRWPWMLVVLDRELEPDPSIASRLFDLGASVGVSVLWLTDDLRRVPRQAEVIAGLRTLREGALSSLTYVDPEIGNLEFEPDRLRLDLADQATRALAPLRDASAVNAAASVPSLVTLFQALGQTEVTAEWVAAQWMKDRGYSLPAPVGLADSGPVVLDLVKHGPHGLIGGTSGAGKSELVQSLVANLIALNSPERVNLLFVDYKGGALSGLFSHVPHSVGAVTNLDALLSRRALTSLKAELDRRMALFETKPKVKDLKDMLELYPEEAPASLVIVVDEFAALVRELPEFVEGIVSIAERGRSLGIHLLLSTQRPSGSINENIQQNTNLRISLRMLDSNESNNVIGTPDAATIPGHLKGRAYARLGPGELIAFQASWSGAPLQPDGEVPPVEVESFGTSDETVRIPVAPIASQPKEETKTQLDAVLDAVVAASQNLNIGKGRAPWKETLPTLLPLIEVLRDPRLPKDSTPGVQITIGMVDDPEAQDQYPMTIDLADGGGVVVYGNGGSGKTTALRTIACSAAIRDHQLGGGGLVMFGLDFASRQLGLIRDLPQCDVVANGDDLESVTRVIALLEQEFNKRQAAVAQAVAERRDAPTTDTILLLIDGYDNMIEQLAASGSLSVLQPWLDRVGRLISHGRQVGIYSAVSTSSFSGPSARLMNTMSNRIVLRQADDNIYRAFGVPAAVAQGLVLEPGQALSQSANLLQVAAICQLDHDGEPTFAPNAIAPIGQQLQGGVAEAYRTEPLPDRSNALPAKRSSSLHVHVGVADLSLEAAEVDLDINTFCVFGPRRSGRSTALRVVGSQLLDAGHEVWAFGRPGSRLDELDGWAGSCFDRLEKLKAAIEELKTRVEMFPDIERFVIFDDADQFDDNSLNGPLKTILDSGVRCVGSASSGRNLSITNPFQKELKAASTVLVLRADDEATIAAAIGPRFHLRPGLEMPPGRGVLIVDGLADVVQVIDPE